MDRESNKNLLKKERAERLFLPPLSELIDRLTVTQIKSILMSEHEEDFNNEINILEHDIDLILQEGNFTLNANLLRSIIVIAQMNLHIWHSKDEMQKNLNNDQQYLKILKHAHQLNGYRNKVKNSLLAQEGIKDKSQIRSNFEVDGLKINLNIKE